MKYWFCSFVIAVGLFSMPSCKEGMDWNNVKIKLQDSIFAALPTCGAVHLNPDNDGTKLLIVVGDPTLYKATHEQQAAKADEIGKMVLRICGNNNYLEKGNFIITTDVHNDIDTPKDGIVLSVDYAGLKKK